MGQKVLCCDDLKRAQEAYLSSRCTTAYLLVALKTAEATELAKGTSVIAFREKKNDRMAAIQNYRALCMEAGIKPYPFGPLELKEPSS